MNEEEKKAIEELEEFIKGPCETCKYCESAYKLNRKNIIQLLNLNKKLQRENEELKERIREHTLLISPYYVKENYIPIQKVKGKIEELNDATNAEKLEDIMNRKNYTITELVQYILQELLAERKEN